MWEPHFSLSVRLDIGLELRIGGRTVAGVDVDLLLEGPGPWHAKGSASLHFFFFTLHAHFEVTWGEVAAAARPPEVTASSVVAEALATPAAWQAVAPADGMVVTFRAVEREAIGVHPLGQVSARQQAVPLGVPIARIGRSQVTGGTATVDVTPLAGSPSATPTTGHFAAAEFVDLTDDEKLSRPSFEPFQDGVAFGGPGTQIAGEQVASASYETVFVPDGQRHVGPLVDVLLLHALEVGAVARSDRHRALLFDGADQRVRVKGAGYRVVAADTLSVAPGLMATFESATAAHVAARVGGRAGHRGGGARGGGLMPDAQYHFLSFVRRGFAASIVAPDRFGADQPALATAPVGVTVSGTPAPVTRALTVRGPGDVIGLAAGEIVRTDPIDGAVGVEPSYFAQVEFDRPDLPWLFTPAAPVGERLRPWVVLVVVDLDGPHPCTLRAGHPLPQLHVPTESAGQLPDLAASYLWAHTQVVTPDGQTVAAVLEADQPPGGPRRSDPRLAVSRLLCPRHLEPFRWYLAAVVPAFDVGRLAGLGLPVTPDDEAHLRPAWQPGGEAILPVLHTFRFRTGDRADFEALARRIDGRHLPAEVGSRPLDVSRPGAGLPATPVPTGVDDTRAIEWLEGALAPLDASAHIERDDAARAAFQTSLTVLLDQPAMLLREGDLDPVVSPPIYGGQHARVVELGSGPPPWIRELNLDPRTRLAAGLGTQVVEERQEDLVARAWRQLGEIVEANRLLRAAQLARSSSTRVHGRLGQLDPPSLLAVSAPAHSRVTAGAALTVARAVRDSRLPNVVVEAAFRRLTRPGSSTARTAGTAGLAETITSRFAQEQLAAPVGGPDGATGMRPASEVVGPEASSAVLVGLGDPQASAPDRLDAVLGTLGAHPRPLPTGDSLRAVTVRSDVGAVTFARGLGAVTADAVSAVLQAATVTGPPPPAHPPHLPFPPLPPAPVPGPILGAAPFPHPVPGIVPLPPALPRPCPAPVPIPGVIFRPPGNDKVISGEVRLRGGAVVITNPTVTGIVRGDVPVKAVDDSRWDALRQQATVPQVTPAADPPTDAGSRLDAIRRDPGALDDLAHVADGRLDALLSLDRSTARLATAGSAAASLQQLATGTFAVPLPTAPTGTTGADDRDAARDIVAGAAAAFDRITTVADAPPPPAGALLDLAAARASLLARIDPEVTVAARLHLRVVRPAPTGPAPRDDLDPVMACPRFLDPMWQALRDLDSQWLLPGLELVPPDTAALVRTNPSFVVAHLVGLNHELMRELLWRGYPTDQRGTGFTRFWGRSGAVADDIGPVHQLSGSLADNLLAGQDGEAVLLLRSELLRRYPGSIVYLSRATQQGSQLALDDGTTVLPAFRGDLPPDITFVGFPITPDELRAPGDPWWFVIAQPPSEPRFGLDEPADDTPPLPATANELAWSHLSPDGQLETPAPFAIADPPRLRGHRIDGLTWGDSAAVQARLTYQRPVRVAIRAADLLPPDAPPPP